MQSVTFRLGCCPHAALGLLACVLILGGCSEATTQQNPQQQPPPPAPLSVMTTTLPSGQVNTPYSATLAATGGTQPYTWSLTGGALPAGLNFDAASGAISGTPTAGASAAALTFQVTDSGSPAQTTTAHLALTVVPLLSITTTSLPNGQVGVAYSAALSAAGGVAPYTWSLTGGTLPAGLSLNTATGAVSGTPTATAAATALTFAVKDAAASAQSTSAVLALTVAAGAPPPAPSVTTTSLPNGIVGKAYSATLTATGGKTPYTWTFTGALPAGLQFNAAGTITGTPTATIAATPLSVTVTDANGQNGSANLTLTVAGVLGITTTVLPNGIVGQAYSATLAATGGVAPYTWTLTGGTLPAGLTLNAATGVVAGKPTVAVSQSVLTFKVSDSGGVQSASANLALTVGGVLSITTTSLPTGFTGKTYTANLVAAGGVGSLNWTITAGTLPTGMTLNARNGVLSGVPTTTANALSLTFKVTDSGGAQSASATLPLTVVAGLRVTTTSLPNGQVGVAYSTTLTATGGSTPYSWSLSGGALPAGLNISSAGVISGTPTATANGTMVTFTVTDAGTTQQNASVSLLLTVSPAGITVSIAPGRAGLTVTQILHLTATTNDNAGVSWSISPAGGSFNPATSLSGADVKFTAPATAGVYTLTATSVTDPTRSASITAGVTDLAGVYTAHNDPARSGANTREYALTKALVSTTTFGMLFSCTVDGAVYAQPLWVANLNIAGGQHNVVFVATEHDSLYAIDADASPCTRLWRMSLIDTAHGAAAAGETSVPAGTPVTGFKVGTGLGNLQPEVGVTGTPVIDPVTNILYVVSKSINAAGTTIYQRLHAIDLFTGNERSGSPATISASYPGTFGGGPSVAFSPQQENQRSGLALVNGTVYISWGSHEDSKPWFGWVMAYTYSGSGFTQSSVFLTSPDASEGGVWMGGGAPAVDDSGNLYVITGNGQFDITNASPPNVDYGDSFLQLNGALHVTSYFTPSDQATDFTGDKDFGSGGSSLVLNLPSGTPRHLVVGGGKDGALYLLNGDNMGGLGDGNAYQMFTVGSGIFDTPAFWNNTLYIAPIGGSLLAFPFNTTTNTFTTTFSSRTNGGFKFPGATPSVSASGTTNGLVWALDNSLYCTGQSPGCGPAILHALDATNLSSEAWNSSTVPADAPGNAVKYTVPTIANGKVYIGTRGNNTGGLFGSTSISGELDVYGLKP
jgi:hypothetical protein